MCFGEHTLAVGSPNCPAGGFQEPSPASNPVRSRLLLRRLTRHVARDEAAVGRQVIGEQRAQSFDVVAPVPVQSRVQFGRDGRDVFALETGLSQFLGARLP